MLIIQILNKGLDTPRGRGAHASPLKSRFSWILEFQKMFLSKGQNFGLGKHEYLGTTVDLHVSYRDSVLLPIFFNKVIISEGCKWPCALH